MTTRVSFETKTPAELGRRWLTSVATRMLRALGLEDEELSLLMTDDARIRTLNQEHRDEDKATDVLAFPMDFEAGASGAGGPAQLLGDVVISVDTARRQALAAGRSLREEVLVLLAHGLLHLVGHDHATPAEKRRMDAATARLVRAAAGP